ncbi:MAG: transposase [Lutispora sp.]
MGRPWREEYRGSIYHVIARGNNKEFIFRESIDKGYFVKQLKEAKLGMGYNIYGFVMMDNHYHLIIQPLDKKLQVIMHQINNKYSKFFNGKYERVGHVFQGRYKAILVQDERQMIRLLRYVHQNPVRANICTYADQYEWSSDPYYRKNIDGFINTKVVLNMLDKDRKMAIIKYIQFMKEYENRDYDKEKIIGDEAYQILFSERKKVIQRKRLDEILAEAAGNQESYELIKAGSRNRNLTQPKIIYAKEALRLKYTNKEIGENINMTESAIKELLRRDKLRQQMPGTQLPN